MEFTGKNTFKLYLPDTDNPIMGVCSEETEEGTKHFLEIEIGKVDSTKSFKEFVNERKQFISHHPMNFPKEYRWLDSENGLPCISFEHQKELLQDATVRSFVWNRIRRRMKKMRRETICKERPFYIKFKDTDFPNQHIKVFATQEECVNFLASITFSLRNNPFKFYKMMNKDFGFINPIKNQILETVQESGWDIRSFYKGSFPTGKTFIRKK